MKYTHFQIFLRIVFFCTLSFGGLSAYETFGEQSTTSAPQESAGKRQWTLFILMEGRGNLNGYARRNLHAMSQVGSSDEVAIIVQWYQKGKPAWRYRIDKRSIVPLGSVESTGSIAQDFIDGMKWTVSEYPAQHYCTILWDHGLGITDPVWDIGRGRWSVDTDFSIEHTVVKTNPRIQIEGITVPDKNAFHENEETVQHRGILFNEEDRTYMKNEDMVYAFSEICKTVLGGKKIDIIGMDACLMGSTEVMYQVREFGKYFVGSEEVELAQGWNYAAFLRALSLYTLSPEELAHSIVATYEHYFKPRTELYTQAAVDLSFLSLVKENVDCVVDALTKCIASNKDYMRSVIVRARRRCQQLSAQSFVDLHSLYTELLHQLQRRGSEEFERAENASLEEYTSLKEHLSCGMKILEKAVIARTSGKYLSRAHGLSIYFPCGGQIDGSYPRTEWSKKTQWCPFLYQILHAE